jgi:uncharacterized membrane protein
MGQTGDERGKEELAMYGPMQLIVIVFKNPNIPIDLSNHLKSVRAQGVIRLVDTVFVTKDEHADLLILEGSNLDLEDGEFQGMMEGAFFGNGGASEAGTSAALVASDHAVFDLSEDDLLEIADRIPIGSSALFLLLEHVWATGVLEAVETNDGAVVASGWITPAELISMGASATNTNESPETLGEF